MNKRKLIELISWSIFLIIFVVAALNYRTLRDYYLAMTFEPTEEVSEIQNELALTETGRRIFLASAPKVVESDEFNSVCDTSGDEVSTLGCFTGQKIYVYNVTSKELDGIKESTTAHELLHAVWTRLSTADKENFTPVLESFYEKSSDKFKDSIKTYDEEDKIEEIFVRSATQVRDLPESLEKEFATIFTNQDDIVDFYDDYIAPFDKLTEEIDSLSAELNSLESDISTKRSEYESRSTSLSAAVNEFNNCAATAGCFSSSYAFYTRRAELVAEQTSLNDLYAMLDSEINSYNDKVNLYNSKIIKGRELNTEINSNKKVETITE